MTRILFVPQGLPPVLGGSHRHAWEVAKAIADLGHEVRVVASNQAGALEARRTASARAFGPREEQRGTLSVRRVRYAGALSLFLVRSRVVRLPCRGLIRRALRSRYRRAFEREIEAEVERFEPDVVLTMSALEESVRAVFRIRRRRSYPVVYVPLLHVEDEPVDAAEEAACFAAADVVVTNTEFERRVVADRYGVPVDRVVTGWLGQAPVPDRETRSGQHVLFLGRLHPQKGIGTLVEAMQSLWADGRARPLVLAGVRGPDTASIEALLRALPDADRDRVRLRANVTEAEKDVLLRDATCLVLPSRSESFGLVFLEAWARSIPVVTWDLPVFRDIVTHEEDGLLVPPDDVAALAQAVARFEDEALRRRMGRCGRETAARRFTWPAVARRYVRALELARSGHEARSEHTDGR